MKTQDEIEDATDQGTTWGLKHAHASGLAGSATLTGEEALDALRRIVIELAGTVADLSLERGEEFAKTFEDAARKEIGRHIPRFRPHLQ